MRTKNVCPILFLFTVFVFLGLCNPALSQVLTAGPTKKPPVIDGKIAPGEWNSATSIGTFIRYGTKGLESNPTILYVTFDRSNLYIAAKCYQNKDVPIADKLDSPMLWDGDSFEVYLQPDQSKSTYYHFAVSPNPAAGKYSAEGTNQSWNGAWLAKAAYNNDGWDVEFAIPFKTIGIDSWHRGEQLGANFTRNDGFHGKSNNNGPIDIAGVTRSTWSYMTGSYHDTNTFGTLILADNVPIVQAGLSPTRSEPGISAHTVINNPTQDVAHIKVLLNSGDSNDESTIDIEPGASKDITLPTKLSFGEHTGVIVITNMKDESTLCSRKFMAVVEHPLQVKQYWFSGWIIPSIAAAVSGDSTKDRLHFILSDGQNFHQEYAGAYQNGQWGAKINVSAIQSGSYTLSAVVSHNGVDKVVDQIIIEKPQSPPWLNSKLGTEDIVLKPWTPVQFHDNIVSIWGRQYTFGNTGYPSAIEAQKQQLLAGAMEMHAVIDNKEVIFKPVFQKLITQKDTRVVISTLSDADGATMQVRAETEYDGMTRIDVSIKGTKAKEIERLYLDIPFKKEFSTLIQADPTDAIHQGTYPYWRGWRTGLMPKEIISGPFTPHIWIGNDNVGLTWFAESQKMWANKDENKVISVIPQANKNILRINFVDYPISARDELNLTFGLEATPVKPMVSPPEFGMYAYYGAELKRMPVDDPANGYLTYPAAAIIDLAKGAAHIQLSPDFNPVEPMPGATRAIRGEPDYPLFSVEFPNGDKFGLYFGVSDLSIRAIQEVGYSNHDLDERIQHPPTVVWENHHWKKGELENISLTWGNNKIAIWSNGVRVASGPFDPTDFSEPISTARICFGGAFTYHSIKIENSTYAGGKIDFQSTDAATTLLDKFDKVDTTKNISNPTNGTVGKLTGTWSAESGQLTLTSHKSLESLLDFWKSHGVGLVHIHESWTESEGYPETNKYQTQLKSLADDCNKLGLRLLPYIGFQLGDNTPEYARYKDEIRVEPFAAERGLNRGDQMGVNISYAGQYQNFMLYSINQLIKEYGIGGLYMDGTAMPVRDMNEAHGAGYIDRQGKRQPSYPIFEYRQFFKRLRTMVSAEDPGFWMDMHTTVGLMTPVSGFGDSIWKGEQYEMMLTDKTTIRDVLDPATIRAEMGAQYGLPTYFLNYDQPREASAVCAILNLPLRLDGGLRHNVLNYYHVSSAQWHPYWENNDSVKISDQETYVSYWKRSDGTIIAAISNLDTKKNTPFEETLSWNINKDGIPQDSVASDAISGERLQYQNGVLHLKLTPWKYRLILIAPEQVQPPIKPGTVWPRNN